MQCGVESSLLEMQSDCRARSYMSVEDVERRDGLVALEVCDVSLLEGVERVCDPKERQTHALPDVRTRRAQGAVVEEHAGSRVGWVGSSGWSRIVELGWGMGGVAAIQAEELLDPPEPFPLLPPPSATISIATTTRQSYWRDRHDHGIEMISGGTRKCEG